MTIREFIESSDFYTEELYFDINSGNKIRYNLTKHDLFPYHDKEIKRFDFITTGDNSGESYLTITFYI